MARPKAARQPVRTTRFVAWSDKVAPLFRLAATGWTPPESVTVTAGAASQTWTARFVDPDGQPFELKIRLRRRTSGWYVAEETLQTRLVGRLGGAR